jgi:hypothetical protein
MKALLFLFLATTALADTMYNWAITNADGTVIAVLVANQAVGSTYPQSIQSIYPDALGAVQTTGAGMGWHYDSTTNTFTAPLPEVTTNVAQAPALFTLQDPTPVTFTTNNTVATPAVTTNNISILTTNNSQ